MKKNILLLIFGIVFINYSYSQVVEMDYGYADNDNVMGFYPMNSSAEAADSMLKYVIVGFDSLYDAVNNIDYTSTNQSYMSLDSFVVYGQHVNHSGQEDTLVVSIVALNSNGYPTDSVLWSSEFKTSVSLGDSTVYSGNSFGLKFFPFFTFQIIIFFKHHN